MEQLNGLIFAPCRRLTAFCKGLCTLSFTSMSAAMATPRGLEPLTSCVTGKRSNQLNYEAI